MEIESMIQMLYSKASREYVLYCTFSLGIQEHKTCRLVVGEFNHQEKKKKNVGGCAALSLSGSWL